MNTQSGHLASHFQAYVQNKTDTQSEKAQACTRVPAAAKKRTNFHAKEIANDPAAAAAGKKVADVSKRKRTTVEYKCNQEDASQQAKEQEVMLMRMMNAMMQNEDDDDDQDMAKLQAAMSKLIKTKV